MYSKNERLVKAIHVLFSKVKNTLKKALAFFSFEYFIAHINFFLQKAGLQVLNWIHSEIIQRPLGIMIELCE